MKFDGQILPQYFGMLDRSGKPLKGGIVGVKLMLLALGYDLEQFSGESIERRLEEAFAEITEAQPEVRIRLSFKNEFQNIRVFEATGTEAE